MPDSGGNPPATTISLRPRTWLESLHARRSAQLNHSRSYGERVILSVLLEIRSHAWRNAQATTPRAPEGAAHTYLVRQQLSEMVDRHTAP